MGRVNKGCQSFQSLVSPPGQVISHGSEVHVLELLSLCLLHFALSIASYFVYTRIYTLPRRLGTDRSVHRLSYSCCRCAAPLLQQEEQWHRISKHPCPDVLSPILRTDDLGLDTSLDLAISHSSVMLDNTVVVQHQIGAWF